MAKPKSSSLNTRNWRGAIFRDPVPDAMELARKVAGVELSDEDRAMLTEAQQQARSRMSGRTIDETGKDISEAQRQPELIQPGWYWTGKFCVWVVGPSQRGQWVHCQTAAGCTWAASRKTSNWQRVHEQVKESGRGFGWRPDR